MVSFVIVYVNIKAFWFFGVNKEGQGKGAAKELWDYIIKMAENDDLPIYLETSVAKNKIVYERFGFEVYHTWDNRDENITIWFMKKLVIRLNK